eukprot:TRINITY_DN1952_c0_g1_i3.p1 TRINITY_DN1952_c0_g1~~TRINITY_DN1952_c0_g1_i3.p1  ORF type:complete len:308 (+),score=32.52 TRINITY_DN1952_c0_g1_i3:65-988(+)
MCIRDRSTWDLLSFLSSLSIVVIIDLLEPFSIIELLSKMADSSNTTPNKPTTPSSAQTPPSGGADKAAAAASLYPTESSILILPCEVQGKVTFGKGCVIHPLCQIISEAGEIIIGDYNIIEERCVIYNKAMKDKNGTVIPNTMRVGSYNIFEVGAQINTAEIGDCNVFGMRSIVDFNCKIKNGCSIGATVKLPPKTPLDDQTSVTFPNLCSKNLSFNDEQHKTSVMALSDLLHKQLPKFNQIKRLNQDENKLNGIEKKESIMTSMHCQKFVMCVQKQNPFKFSPSRLLSRRLLRDLVPCVQVSTFSC